MNLETLLTEQLKKSPIKCFFCTRFIQYKEYACSVGRKKNETPLFISIQIIAQK